MARLRGAVLAAAVLSCAGMAGAGAQTTEVPTAPVGRTPPLRATAEDTAPARAYEPPSLLIHPTDPETIVGATIELTGGLCKLIRSFDGGHSWALADKTPSP